MKKHILASVLLLISACQSSPKDITLTASNKQEVIQQVLPDMSETEMQTLLSFRMRKSMDKISDQISAAIANGSKAPTEALNLNDQWEVLPEGMSINEILKDQQEFEATSH